MFIPSKASLDRIGDGLAFRIEQCALANPAIGGSDIVASRIAWETEPVTISADAAIAGLSSRGGENNSAKAIAIDFLQSELACGPKPASEILKLARDAGHTPKAVRLAREALGVLSSKVTSVPHGPWIWTLPGFPGHAAEETPSQKAML